MNAEFLEKDIVVRIITGTDGKRRYTADSVRKNLTAVSFIGATVVTEDNLQAYKVKIAKTYPAANPSSTTIIRVKAGPYLLPYMPDSGTFGATTLN